MFTDVTTTLSTADYNLLFDYIGVYLVTATLVVAMRLLFRTFLSVQPNTKHNS